MRLRHAFSISLFAQGIVLLVGFLNSIIITRNLDLSGRGQYALAMSVLLMINLIAGDILYRSGSYFVSKKSENWPDLFGNGIIFAATLSAILFILIQFAGNTITGHLLPGLNQSFLLLIIWGALPMIWVRFISGLYLGKQKYFRFNLLGVAPLVVFCLLNIILYLQKSFSAEKTMINYAVAMTIVGTGSIILLGVDRRLKLAASWELFKESFRTGLKFTLSTFFLFMLFRVDIFLINYLLGTEEAGLYSIAVILSEMLQKVANTSGTVIFPKIAGMESRTKQRDLSNRTLLFILLAGILFSVLLYLFGESIIILIFKERYAGAAQPLYYLLPGTVIMALGKILLFSLWGQGGPRITLVVPAAAFILNTCLNIILIPQLGIIGAAISTSISYIVFGLSLIIYYSRNKPAVVAQSDEYTPISQ